MYNANQPLPDDLPSSRQLLRSTLLALVAAAAILVAVVLPAEYGIDPTGAGRALGLTQMGQLKQQLEAEAAADAARDAARAARIAQQTAQQTATPSATPARRATATPSEAGETRWRDQLQVVVAAGRGTEVKLTMRAGERAHYSWVAAGGLVNFDAHGHDENGVTLSYEKGRAVANHAGVIDAAFDGEHGWFWRNLGETDVTLTLQTRGQYSDIYEEAM